MRGKLSQRFKEYLMDVEGGDRISDGAGGMKSNIDPDTGNWMPYQDSVGLWTIGVGHLIGDGKSLPEKFRDGISVGEVYSLLEEDGLEHADRARKAVGDDVWDSLDDSRREMLTDIEFNGGVKRFPSFTKAVINNDVDGMSREHHRYAGSKGNKRPLDRRNRKFAEFANLPYISAEYA